MFDSCRNLTSFPSDLPSLTNGQHMFYYCKNLASFSADLHSLNYGNAMFYYCTNLASFSADLSSLGIGSWMFYECSSLDTVTIKLKNISAARGMFAKCGKIKNLNLEYYANSPSAGIDCREMFNGCDFRNMNLNISLTNPTASSKHFIVGDGRRMFGYPEEKDVDGNLTSNYVLNGEQWGKLISGRWWLLGSNTPRGAIFEATVDYNIMVPQSDGSIWCSATNLLECGFRYFRIKYKDSNNKPAVVYGDSIMEDGYSLEKPVGNFWNIIIDDLSVDWEMI
jgi:hypothetical protein